MNFGDSWSSQNSQSPLLRMGVGMDPLAQLFPGFGDWKVRSGDKLQKWVSNNIADEDPLIQHDRHDGLASWSKEARKVSDWAQAKPLDSTALVVGGVLGGGAAMGAWGEGAGAGAGAAGSGAGAGLGTGGGSAAPSVAGFMPGTASGAGAGLEGVTVVGSSGGAAMTPGTAAAMGAAAASASGATPQQGDNNNWKDWLDRAQQMQGQGGGQQQEQPSQTGQVMQRKQPTMMERIQGGLGRMGEAMFPIDQAYGASPEQQAEARRQAYIQMGLGMMAAAGQGGSFGEAANFGYGQATKSLNGALQRGYENARSNRQEQRQAQMDAAAQKRQEIEDNRWQAQQDYRLKRDSVEDTRAQAIFDRGITQDQRAEARWRAGQEQQQSQFEREMRLREEEAARKSQSVFGTPPAGYRWKPDGSQEPIPGGPADPANKTGNYQESERNAAFLGSRLANALNRLDAVEKIDPSAAQPGWTERGLGAVAGETAANLTRSPERRQANAAQRDALDAALTLATGLSYTNEQIDAMRVSYFPQLGDDEATKAAKKQSFESLLEFAKTKAGRAATDIEKVRKGGGATGKWSIEEAQ